MGDKYVYFFGDGKADGSAKMKDLLGGKGANLHEMTRLGIPVPPGFTISTEVCTHFYAHERGYPKKLEKQVDAAVGKLEKLVERKFGDTKKPLLVSVRSGARASMPGMMDTVLNLGLNDDTVAGLAARADERFAWDCYRRFMQMYGDVVLEIPKKKFEALFDGAKRKRGTRLDTELTAADLKGVVAEYKKLVEKEAGKSFPMDVRDQLWGAIGAVFGSWNNQRAITYRKLNHLPDDWGTAVNVQTMVFGNLGESSATGVAFTRDPATGENRFYGEYLVNAQGEDVVAGIRTPQPVNRSEHAPGASLEEKMPKLYGQLCDAYRKLEQHYRDMQDLEFTIQDGKLYLLQTRNGKRTGFAAVKIAVDMVEEGLIDEAEALRRVQPEQLLQLLAPTFEPKAKKAALDQGQLLTKGLPAGPGAACGRIAFTADKAVEMAKSGEPVILARSETSPEDIAGMSAAAGIVTSRGGMTSHAAVVARGMGKCCVVGAGELAIDDEAGKMTVGQRVFAAGDWIAVEGTSGQIFGTKLPTRPSEVIQVLIEKTLAPEKSENYERFAKLLAWADEKRRLGVRTNADTPVDATAARAFGAQGIGLCRTEHMFFQAERILAVRQMILATSAEERRRPLEKILPMQRQDFVAIFKAMEGLPVTIRLLDPPLHEFLPHEEAAVASVAEDLGVKPAFVRERVEALKEFNPMLGHRGCRLGITHPEIYEMQVQAILEAAVEVAAQGVKVAPEVMIPIVGTAKEFEILAEMTHRVARQIFEKKGRKVDYKVGTMIEIPRACVVAGDIAKTAEFFSFGTNDLTQMTYGYSRDDSGVFLNAYVQQGILPGDPFASLDQGGVGELVRMASERGRAARKGLKLGVCGEHGGDPASIGFFHGVGLDYVSCSPYRVPIARLAAARAALGVAEDRTA
ncbi:MAG: pyruvate, phosphate dikinase [Deltaproteobacteria bacterium]|nr:pyruvate, phosphate dikinase [Deltaproteobacteria bacterium]